MMSQAIKYLLNKASEADIRDHLLRCNNDFVPHLSSRVEISDYARKISDNATRIEAWVGDNLVGLLAVYVNDRENGAAFVTSNSVLAVWTRKGIASRLLGFAIEQAIAANMRQIELDVAGENARAMKLYEKFGFVVKKKNSPFVCMKLVLNGGKENEKQARLQH